MKWVALFLILMAAPLIAVWLRSNPKQAPLLWGLLTFLPFVQGPWNLEVAPFATPLWSGYVKGWEIGLVDAIAFGVIVGMRGRWPKMILLLPFLAYFVAVLLAVFQSRFPNLALSYPVQLIRVGLVFLAIARVATLERGERALLIGLVCGLTVQAGYALWATANGALQSGGSLGHQNLLGFLSHMALMPVLALFLSGRMPRWALLGVVSGLTVVILTASRATIGFAGLGLVLTLILSITIRFTPRKAAIGVAGVVLLAASFPLAYAKLEQRFAMQNTTFLAADEERIAFERAARAIIADNPLGIGPNHYVFVANTEGYSAAAGVAWNSGSRSTNVHHTYLLVAAETGPLGLLTLVLLLGLGIYHALMGAIRYRQQPGSEVLIGLGIGLVAVVIHGFFEWMLVVSPTQYLLASTLGLIVGMRSRLAGLKDAARRRKSAAVDWTIQPSGSRFGTV